MYYLDLFTLYIPTTKAQRIEARLFNRDEMMLKKLKHQHYQCFFCAADVTMASHLDHLVPVYYGGRSILSNLVAACKSCNLIKGTQAIEITNPYTIKDYIKLKEAKRKWTIKEKQHPHLKRYQPKRVRLYGCLRADLFRSVR